MFYVIGDPLLLGRAALINGTNGGMDMNTFSNVFKENVENSSQKRLNTSYDFLLWVFCHGWKNEAELHQSRLKLRSGAMIPR